MTGVSKLIAVWIGLVVVLVLATKLDGGWTMRWLALEPHAVWRGQLWRLVTWALVERNLFSAAVTCMLAYRFGNWLATTAGDAPVLRYMIVVAVVAGLATCAVATLIGHGDVSHLSGRGITFALMIANLRQDRVIVYETIPGLPMKGKAGYSFVFTLLAIGFVIDGPFAYATEAFAVCVALIYPASRLAARTSL